MRVGLVVFVAAALSSACTPGLSPAARQVILVESRQDVVGCAYIGVVGGVRNEALELAAVAGASHVLWVNIETGLTADTMQGEAYQCQPGPDVRAATPPGGDVPPAVAATAAPAPPPPPAPAAPTTWSGTCFFAADGVAITNQHVVADATTIRVIDTAGAEHAATVLRVAPESDLAVLDVPTAPHGSALAIDAAPDAAVLGEDVFTIGFPLPGVLGVDPKFSAGAISGLTGFGDKRVLQITLPIQPGNSGGPLVTDGGRVVGVIAAKLDAVKTFNATGTIPEGVGFAIKASELTPLLRGLALPRAPRVKTRAAAIARTQASVCQVIVTRGPAPAEPAAPPPAAEPAKDQLSKAQIATTIGDMAGRLHQCRVSHDHSPFDRVKVSVHVAPDGEVVSVELTEAGADRDSRARCVGFVFKATRFPATPGGGTFRYTVKVE